MEPKPLFQQVSGGEVLNVSFNDFRRMIEACGYRYQGPRGIRQVFAHPRVEDPLILQPLRNQDTKPDEILKFLEIAKEHNLHP